MNRREVWVFVALMLCALLLSGCGKKSIRGEVTEVLGNTGELRFILTQENGQSITVTTDENTHIFSWIEEASETDLRSGEVEGLFVTVTGRKSRNGLAAEQVMIDQRLMGNYTVLEDGTPVDLLVGLNENSYCLGDGTQLLAVRTLVGPDNVATAGSESLDSLPEEARQNIIAYYEAQGILYDEKAVLEEAYDAYYILKDEFSTYHLSQEIVPTASSGDVIYFLTVATLPDGGPYGSRELRLGAAFDMETGIEIPMTDLFACKPEEIIPKLAEICMVDDPALVEEMKEEFRPEYVAVFPDNVEITFSAGVLTDYGSYFGMGADLRNEAVLELLQPWAVPTGQGGE